MYKYERKSEMEFFKVKGQSDPLSKSVLKKTQKMPGFQSIPLSTGEYILLSVIRIRLGDFLLVPLFMVEFRTLNFFGGKVLTTKIQTAIFFLGCFDH